MKLSEETSKSLNGLRTEVAAEGIVTPITEHEQGWNEALRRVLSITDQYLRGEGLFQQSEE